MTAVRRAVGLAEDGMHEQLRLCLLPFGDVAD
jgi:hypothetical protein